MRDSVDPLVSVGVASFNCSKYILQTLDSIRTQSYSPIELIIADDHSTEDNVQLIEQWIITHNVPCKFIKHPANTGVVRTCNDLLDSATGEYFVLIGSDDVMEPTRIQEQLDFMRQGFDVVLSDMKVIGGNDEVIDESYFSYIKESKDSVKSILSLPVTERLAFTIRKNVFPSPGMIYKTSLLRDLGGWDNELFFEDWDMILRIIAGEYRFGFLDKSLVRYRVLNTSLARTPNPRYTASLLTLVSKHKGRSSSVDQAIADHVDRKAMELYFARHRSARKWLYRKWQNKPTIANLLVLMKSIIKG